MLFAQIWSGSGTVSLEQTYTAYMLNVTILVHTSHSGYIYRICLDASRFQIKSDIPKFLFPTFCPRSETNFKYHPFKLTPKINFRTSISPYWKNINNSTVFLWSVGREESIRVKHSGGEEGVDRSLPNCQINVWKIGEARGIFKPGLPPMKFPSRMAPDRLKLLKPPSATRETARHVRNWKATDVDNVSGIKAGAGYRERIRIREKCKGGKQTPLPPFCFLCKFSPRREVKPNREHDISRIFFRFRNDSNFFFCFNVPMLIFFRRWIRIYPRVRTCLN